MKELKKNKRRQKLIAAILCVVLVLSSAMTAFAEESADVSASDTQTVAEQQAPAESEVTEGTTEDASAGENPEVQSTDKTATTPAEDAGTETVTEVVKQDSSNATVSDEGSEDGQETATVEETETNDTTELSDGVNIIAQGAEGNTYNINDGKCVMIAGTSGDPIVFKNCTFNLSGKTMKISGAQKDSNGNGISYNNGETITKLFVGRNVQFDNCTFVTNSGEKSSAAGYDACIYFFSGNIVLNNCSLTGTNYQGQFLGLYGSSGSVTFNSSKISTTGNTGGWSYAMYGASVLNLNNSTMTATGMKRAEGGGNVNAFYSGDLRTNYDAINIKDSTVDFSDNYGGGFAINRVNIHVDNSTIRVNDNAGNGSNSGKWYMTDSTLEMNGNRTHGWSHISDESKNCKIECLHNGYAGYYITDDSSYQNCEIDIRCNGEKYLSYSAGDAWLNTHTATFTNCKHVWLGAVGRKGVVKNNGCEYFVAYDLVENKTKGSTAAVLTGVKLSEQDEHYLFLNPSKSFDYARGDTEGKTGNSNDDDLFEEVEKATVIGKDTAKIGTLTTAQLSHHKYNWKNGEITDAATIDTYGVVKYACTDTCLEHIGWTEKHADSFSCDGTYVYAPLVGLAFDANVEDDSVTNMPENQTKINYGEEGTKPANPSREGYTFTGWYTDKECTEKYDFNSDLTANWTVVYAGWKAKSDTPVDPTPTPTPAEWQTSKSKTATNLDENFKSNVTLSLPSAEEQLVSDVVLVLDKSTSASVETKALEMLQNLKSQIKKTNAKVKVGVVIFNKVANVTEFKDLATEYADIEAAIKQEISSGTNTHAGLIAGESMLDADKSVDSSRKYLIFVSDGLSYIYDEEPTVTAWSFQADAVLNWAGTDNWNSKYGSNEAPSDWNAWLDTIGEQIENQGTKYEYSYGGTAVNVTPVAKSAKYANSIDIALYKTYKQYQSIASKYHAYAMVADPNNGSQYKWGPSFINYLAKGEKVDFGQIQNDITYLLDEGSRVEDYMGYVANDYDFDFVNDASTLSIKVGDATYEAVKIEDNHYGFGQTSAGYMYEVIYSAGNKQDEEHFTWKINVPVSNFAPVQLTYQVQLMNPKTADGTYGQYDADGSKKYDGLYTNNSATLYPVDSNGTEGNPEIFNKPTVEYTVKAGEVVTPVVPSEPVVDDPGNDPGKEPAIEDPADSEPGKTVKKPKATKTESKKKAETVKTGDNTNIIFWICLLALSGVAVISVPVISARLRRGRRRR